MLTMNDQELIAAKRRGPEHLRAYLELKRRALLKDSVTRALLGIAVVIALLSAPVWMEAALTANGASPIDSLVRGVVNVMPYLGIAVAIGLIALMPKRIYVEWRELRDWDTTPDAQVRKP